MNDSDDAASAVERFEDFARKVFSKTKDDLKKAQEIVDEAIGPPPAVADDED